VSRALLADAVDRVALDGHDGRSGARIERVTLADGRSLILKKATAAEDITFWISGGIPRERRLWESGALDRLGGPVGHAILDIWDDGDATVTLMRDLGDSVPGWSRVLSGPEVQRILEAMAAVHATFTGDLPADLCPLEARLGALSPRVMEEHVGQHALADVIVHGWERFADVTSSDLLHEVRRLHADPAPLAAAMRNGAITLLHADLWLVNLALTPEQVVFLDWAIATEGPPALDLSIFLTGSAANVDPTRAEMIDEFRTLSPHTDDRAIDLALLQGLLEMGWNKALDATEHEDPSVRQRERADLEWWQARASETLDRGWL
jgi:Phosphotransferase enzyme family